MLAYTVLRVIVGIVLIYLGFRHTSHRDAVGATSVLLLVFGIMELIIGLMFLVGWYTQYASLLTVTLIVASTLMKRNATLHTAFPQTLFYVLLFGSALSLFVTGAGAFAFDLPL